MDDQAPHKPQISAIRDWLIEDAAATPDVGAVLDGLCRRLVAIGLPLARATTHLRVIHSERVGVTRVWRRGQKVEEQHFGFEPEVDQMYQRSPIRIVHDSGQRFDLFPDRAGAKAFGVTEELIKSGITHYVIFPLRFSDGRLNAASFATDRAGGFREDELTLIQGLLPALTRALEVKSLRRGLSELLRIYVGREPANRILDGQIRRGDVASLDAAILIVDLRRSTEYANRLSEEEFVLLLNRFFDCVVPAVKAAGGEVLKFMGDAVLAIFDLPAKAEDCSHCQGAMKAAKAIQAALAELNEKAPLSCGPMEVAIALHEGRVAYGNVGSVERQDFTVISRDVNLASRVAKLAGELDRPLLMSERIARRLPQLASVKIGDFPLKGFADPQAVFAPANA